MKDKKHGYFVANLGRYIAILFFFLIGTGFGYIFITSKQWGIEVCSFTHICILIAFFVAVRAFQEAWRCADPEEMVEWKR